MIPNWTIFFQVFLTSTVWLDFSSSTPASMRNLLAAGDATAALRGRTQKTVFANGDSESDLPVCSPHAVCSRIELYFNTPKIHRLCRCPGLKEKVMKSLALRDGNCPTNADDQDGRSIRDDGQLLKLCGSVQKFPVCRFFHDTAYTVTTYPAQNRTQQVIRCVCPKDSTTYMLKWKQKHFAPNHKMTYHYGCSPQTFLQCGKDEPCNLFVDSGSTVNKQTVCSCPQGSICPAQVTDPTVKPLTFDVNLSATTYAAYCDHPAA